MPVIIAATTCDAAEIAAQRLRLEGFLARAACRGETALVIVSCVESDRELVLQRVRASDAQSNWLEARSA